MTKEPNRQPAMHPAGSDTTVRLGRTDIHVSRIGVGTAAWGKDNLINVFGSTERPEDEEAAFRASLEAGVTLFDTAAQYKAGNSEIRLGELAKGSPAIIATKYSPGLGIMPPLPWPSSALPGRLERSLRRLGRDSIDLYQVHFPVPFVSIRRMMDRMADAVEAGKIRAVGVSNFSEARGIPLASNQIHYSLLYRRPEFDGVLKACRELEITPIAFMPMAMGLLTGKYRPDTGPTDWVRRRLTTQFRPEAIEAATKVTDLLAKIGDRYGKTSAQVALRWVIEQGVIPIPGAKNARQAIANAGALTFSLTSDEVAELSASASDWVQEPNWRFGPRLMKK